MTDTSAPAPGWARWFRDPRAAVLIALFLIVLVGGGRKLLRSWRGRGAVLRLGEADASVEDVEAVVEFGREGLMELFRILGTAESAAMRDAAGHALSVLWRRDELITEEEKALVRRGFDVRWSARRRYPRAIQGEIPIAIAFGVPFLRPDGLGISPENLKWSYTIVGARRAGLETPSPWKAGPGHAQFALIPGDFDTNGPFRLALQARVRTIGLTDRWELELPLIPFSFEFDPLLKVDALLTLGDAARGESIAGAVRLVEARTREEGPATFLDLNSTLALRDPPLIAVRCPLTCDLAHAIELEIEGIPGRHAAGSLIVGGQGSWDKIPGTTRHFPLGPVANVPPEILDRPGQRRVRAILVPDPDRGWTDPEIRSIWPEPVVTDWIDVEVVRR